ncbi:MAG TPA: hypothetical protein DCX89_04340 [Saprospirales bacterium]|nr:hypothetical protein [Saprospirales bacterium]HAY71096.1 hypothetical protein [Saprospirales bacterium]
MKNSFIDDSFIDDKMISMKRLAYLIMLFFLTSSVRAQQNDFISIVYLKDGSVLEGKMTEFRENQFIKMDLGGNEVTISYASIQKIKHKNLAARSASVYGFKEKGLYNQTSLGFLPGKVSTESLVGLEFDHSIGYLLNRWLGLGLNLGLATYDQGSNDIYYSVSGECRGYLLAKNFSPYYTLKGGYGFINADESFLEANGGYFFNPSLGYRFSGRSNVSFILEGGLTFQKGYYKQDLNSFWWGGTRGSDFIEKDILYRRISIKMGVLF